MKLRLRHKLSFYFVLVALVPLFVASSVAAFLVMSGLDRAARDESERALRVGVNLLLGQIRETFETTRRVTRQPLLSRLLADNPGGVEMLLARERQLPRGLVEVAGAGGGIVARHQRGVAGRLADLRSPDRAPSVMRALGFEQRVTLERIGDGLAIRALAPVVDEDTFALRGAVVATVPLDTELADRLKAELSADVVFYAGEAPIASSFVDDDGRRQPGFAPPAAGVLAVWAGGTAVADVFPPGRHLSAGFAPLVDSDGNRLGMIAVALDKGAVAGAKRRAWNVVALGGLFSLAFAFLLAALLARRLTRPLGRLHEGTLAVARGDLATRFVRETGDEIGDLAEAFARMTESVRLAAEELEGRVRERTRELAEANARLEELAVTDGLTNLLNHRRLHERLAEEIDRTLRTGASLALLMLDVDHFKDYNDRCGHPAGDLVLREAARLLSAECRAHDVVARYGGEEFVVILIGAERPQARLIAERLRLAIATHPFPRGAEQPGGALTVSIGVAVCPEDAITGGALVEAADRLLYRAKHAGRNRVEAGPQTEEEQA